MFARFVLILCLVAAGCGDQSEQKLPPVDANQYEAFWLWAGVKPQPVLDEAKAIYILGAEIRAPDRGGLQVLRPFPPDSEKVDIWLVVRLETLELSESDFAAILDLATRWSLVGNKLAGVQIDFDANTRGLDIYATFLGDLRQRLPKKYRLSITGLMDWSANGNSQHLQELAGVVDEAVFQTYQDRDTIPGYEKWLRNLDDLPMPFRIGLVQGGEWLEPDILSKNPNFKGYVIFLLNSENQ